VEQEFHIIIPARMDSERLPGKPLAKIQGVPMVIRVANVCIEVVGKENVTVSTPDLEIVEVCTTNKVPVVKSSLSCRSGTDRIVEFAQTYNFKKYVNVQGDEPLLPAKILREFLNESIKSDASVVGISQILDPALVQSESVVKVAVSDGFIVYASRSPLPNSALDNEPKYLKHTGLYTFTRNDILNFGKNKKGSLEIAENVEILRLIERGIRVRFVEIENFGRAVDTQRDLQFVEKYGKFKSSND
jgi:3-deoxy-manno-octulosonate cytidylyltransferase (CMP-KDO synthetase)